MFKRQNGTDLAIARLEDSIKTLSAVVGELQSANKRLQLEWTETYDKVRHQLSRMARRGELTNGKDPAEIVPGDDNADDGIDPISAKILARRSRMFLGGK